MVIDTRSRSSAAGADVTPFENPFWHAVPCCSAAGLRQFGRVLAQSAASPEIVPVLSTHRNSTNDTKCKQCCRSVAGLALGAGTCENAEQPGVDAVRCAGNVVPDQASVDNSRVGPACFQSDQCLMVDSEAISTLRRLWCSTDEEEGAVIC